MSLIYKQVPVLPLKKAKINNADTGYIEIQESDDKRTSQASSGGSWPSWTYVYYSPRSFNANFRSAVRDIHRVPKIDQRSITDLECSVVGRVQIRDQKHHD